MPVVNVNTLGAQWDVYVGRMKEGNHFGNPFSHVRSSLIKHHVDSREEAVVAFEMWLLGEAFLEVEPERRKYIIDNLHLLKGRKLGCLCKPAACHGDVLERLANNGLPV